MFCAGETIENLHIELAFFVWPTVLGFVHLPGSRLLWLVCICDVVFVFVVVFFSSFSLLRFDRFPFTVSADSFCVCWINFVAVFFLAENDIERLPAWCCSIHSQCTLENKKKNTHLIIWENIKFFFAHSHDYNIIIVGGGAYNFFFGFSLLTTVHCRADQGCSRNFRLILR